MKTASSSTAHAQWFLDSESLPFMELRTTHDSQLPYAKHFHSGFSLGVILSGATSFSLGAQSYQAKQGDLVLIPAGCAHSCNPIEGQARSYHMMIIEERWMQDNVFMPLSLENGCALSFPLVTSPSLWNKITRIIQEIHDTPLAPGHEAALAAFFIALHKHAHCFKLQEQSSQSTNTLSVTKWPPIRVLTNNHTDTVTVLALRAGIRRESLARLWRKKTHLSPLAILHCLRLEKAKWLLRQGASIADVAYSTGYTDQSHFHRMFVKYYSVTPGSYKRCRAHLYKK